MKEVTERIRCDACNKVLVEGTRMVAPAFTVLGHDFCSRDCGYDYTRRAVDDAYFDMAGRRSLDDAYADMSGATLV